MQLKLAILFFFTCVCVQHIQAQHAAHKANNGWTNNTQFVQTDSGLLIINYTKTACKTTEAESGLVQNLIDVALVRVPLKTIEPPKPKFLIVHGNVSYDYFYRSKIDTPFNQQNLQQHTERVWLDVLIKGKYPFKVGFTARQSNSPFFRDIYNANINFDSYNYAKGLKQSLLNRLSNYEWENPDLKLIDTALKFQLQKYELLKKSINEPAILQKLVEKKEAIYFKHKRELEYPHLFDSINTPTIPTAQINKFKKKLDFSTYKDSLPKINKDISLDIDEAKYKKEMDSLAAIATKEIYAEKSRLDSLVASIKKLKQKSDSIRNGITQKIAKAKQVIYKLSTPKEIEKFALENGIKENKKDKIQNGLANIKTLGVGRSLVDYTELTAQNIMLTGINVEYNPSYYVAVAAGKIDYGFRDFFGKTIKQSKQYLTLGRVGWGNRDKRSIILTVFNGRKNNYAGLLAADSGNNTAKLFGYSVETTIKKSANTFITAEVAKSTKYNNGISQTASNKSNDLFRYSDKSNMGFNIKAQTEIKETNTRLSGFYRKTGEQFQSFSLFTYNTNQEAWQVRADQSLLKQKINVTAMLRQNDFTNPLAQSTFKTTTVFKSVQLNVKVPHWPVINAGYYPGSQFYIVDDNTVRENVYYILNGSLIYPYTYKDISMSSAVMYNRFFNQSTDTGFVYYKGINYTISQSIFLKKLQLQGSYAYNQQAALNFYTLDANGDYSIKEIFKIGGGVKYNHVQSGEDYWGQAMRVSANFKQWGGLQLSYEKSYLPTIQQTLYPVEIGRVSWYKFF